MRPLLLSIFLLALAVCSSTAQVYESVCADPLEQYRYTGTVQRGGVHRTSEGTIRVLVVFEQFPGDTSWPGNPDWPQGSPAAFGSTFIDPEENEYVDPLNLSAYYRDASFGRFSLLGDTVVAVPLHPWSHYKSLYGQEAYGWVNHEIPPCPPTPANNILKTFKSDPFKNSLATDAHGGTRIQDGPDRS